MRQKEEKRQVTRESEKRGVKPSVVQKELDTAKSSPFAMFGEGMSNIGGYNNGGSIFSGIVGKNDGTRVSGAGEDTQYFPVAGGGGAVLAPNELVLNEKQQAQMHQDTGVHPASYVSGVQPKKLSEKRARSLKDRLKTLEVEKFIVDQNILNMEDNLSRIRLTMNAKFSKNKNVAEVGQQVPIKDPVKNITKVAKQVKNTKKQKAVAKTETSADGLELKVQRLRELKAKKAQLEALKNKQ